jgi:hypothetical protein
MSLSGGGELEVEKIKREGERDRLSLSSSWTGVAKGAEFIFTCRHFRHLLSSKLCKILAKNIDFVFNNTVQRQTVNELNGILS